MADLTRLFNFVAENGEIIDPAQVDAELDQIIAALNALDLENLATALQQQLSQPGDYCLSGRTSKAGWLLSDGSASGNRVTHAALFDAITYQKAAATTNASAVVTGLASTLELAAGFPVEGVGIPVGATILTVDSGTQVTLSAAATVTGAPTLRFFPYGNGNGATTFNVPDWRRRFPLGADNSTAVPAGANDGQAAASRNPTHAHTIAHTHTFPNHSHSGFGSGNTGADAAPSWVGVAGGGGFAAGPGHTHPLTLGVVVGPDGGGTTGGTSAANSGNVTSPFLACNVFIKI